jgi:hypothetical protein
MQKLTKTTKPQVLVQNEEQWTDDYVAAVANGDSKRYERWRHPEIKKALRQEVRSRCAYCEGFVDDVSFPHVEHIIPKAIAPELAHRWINLTSACGRCNNAKGDFYDQDNGLLNPYVDDLDRHISFLGSLIQWELGSARGELTIRQLGLNRFDLAKERAKRLEAIRGILDRWHAANQPLRGVLEESLRLDAEEGEFSGAVVAYLRSFQFPI